MSPRWDTPTLRGYPVRERFDAKVERAPGGCWIWKGCVNQGGYGMFTLNGKARIAHRVAYELYVGPIPVGLTLDHTCHDPAVCALGNLCPHRSCVNPAHLEPVTMRENTLRGGSPAAIHAAKTKCIRGHEFVSRRSGRRDCPTCANETRRERRRQHRITHLLGVSEGKAAA